MVVAIILGDVHLGANSGLGKIGIGAAQNSRITDQCKLLDWVLERAIEHCAEHIVATGDIWDIPNPSPNLITLLIHWIKKCQAHNVNVHLIVGNHDLSRSGHIFNSSLDILTEAELANCFVYKYLETITLGQCSFTMMPFRDRKSLGAATNAEALAILQHSLEYEAMGMEEEPLAKVLVGHLALEGSIPTGNEIDDLANELMCPLSMFQGYDYVIMGHIHKYQVLQHTPFIAHLGSMDISNFGETEHKKHIMVFDCDQPQWHLEDLPTRPLQKIVVQVPPETLNTTEYVIQQIQQRGIQEQAIVRVEVALTAPELNSINKSAIDQFLLSNGASSVNQISESKKSLLIKKDDNNNIDNTMDIQAAVKTYANTYIEDKLRSSFITTAMDLYQAFQENNNAS